jgi:hypothetical protein
MIAFTDSRPNPAAPSIFGNKLGGIYRLRVTFALAAGGSAGAVEAASLLWENAELDEVHRMLRWAFDGIRRGVFGVDARFCCIRAN